MKSVPANFHLLHSPHRWRANLLRLWMIAGMLAAAGPAFARCCVWKVTSGGHTLYLAGSVHALRGTDYPLPEPYEQAFRASSVLSFETDSRKVSTNAMLGDAARLPYGSTLRDHLDPRVYAYIQQVLATAHGSTNPEKKLEHLRPWAIGWLLQSPKGIEGVSHGEGVDSYLERKAIREKKEITGLVPVKEHIAVFGGMSDADGQAFLLNGFIGLNQHDKSYERIVRSWKVGDIDDLQRAMAEEYRDTPSLRNRMITDRNRRWIPVIEQYLQSGKTCMVVAGSYHMAGSEGVPALLKAKGLKVEQL